MLRESDEDIKAAEQEAENAVVKQEAEIVPAEQEAESTAVEQDATMGLSFDGITKNLAEALMILIDELYKKQQMPRETKKKESKNKTLSRLLLQIHGYLDAYLFIITKLKQWPKAQFGSDLDL